jgi:outer membrane protein TolC
VGAFAAMAEQTNAPGPHALITEPISLADALNIALKQNPTILRGQKDLETTAGVVLETRAIAIPKVQFTGSYSALANSDLDAFNFGFAGTNITFGNAQAWNTRIRVVQSLYEGGKIASSLRTARLLGEHAVLIFQTGVADTILAVQTAYYDVLVTLQQITVQEASVQLLTRELTETTRRFNAGTVPRFNVLRAEVELANAKPKLIRARNAYHIAKNNLANVLGFNAGKDQPDDVPLILAGKLEAEPFEIDLSRAITSALERRTELAALRKSQALRQEDIVNAKAGYKPSLEAYAGYDAHNSVFSSEISTELHGWVAGVQMNWDIFDGLRTRGRVKEARAQHDKAGIEVEDAIRRIELEVRTALFNFREADEVLKSQVKVVEQGEEALRLANARAEAGSSTQLDVLSAQTALTDARTTQIEALHHYAVARAKLERAIGANAPNH